MNCEEYITNYLSAHADGELTSDEERAAVQHLGSGPADGCSECRVRLTEERLLKALIRRQAATVKTPEEIRTRINAALDWLDRGSAPKRIGTAAARELRRPRTWVPLAAAAMLFVVLLAGGDLFGLHRSTSPARNGISGISAGEALDQAVYSYETFETAFRPTVPSASLSAIAMAYGSADMPDLMWNFEFAGYDVVGGRIDRLPDGNPVTYTLYHGRNGDILCTRYKASDFAVPPGAVGEIHGHLLYEYNGYSLCVTVSKEGRFICVLTSSEPIDELRHDVSLARAFSIVR
ncbi:MAG: anti-sigma factor family protein [Candidatus Binataceae bacterium]